MEHHLLSPVDSRVSEDQVAALEEEVARERECRVSIERRLDDQVAQVAALRAELDALRRR